jgi:hypothetical protein
VWGGPTLQLEVSPLSAPGLLHFAIWHPSH